MTARNGMTLEIPTAKTDPETDAFTNGEPIQLPTAQLAYEMITMLANRVHDLEDSKFAEASKHAKRAKSAAGQHRHLLNRVGEIETRLADLETQIAELQRVIHNLRKIV